MIRNLKYQDGRVFFRETPLHFSGLRVLSLHGQGANALVFKAQDLKLNRIVALKVWDLAVSPADLDRALAETRKLAAISHPLFVTVHRYDRAGVTPFAVLEFVHGETATEWLRASSRSAADRYALWRMYVEALRIIYRLGSVHGDPHTGNILVFRDDSDAYAKLHETMGASQFGVKLTDLGTSQLQRNEPIQDREAWVIIETVERIWAPDKPRDLLDMDAHRAIPFVVFACESYANVKWCLARLAARRVEDDYSRRRDVIGIAFQIAAVPVYDLMEVESAVRICAGPEMVAWLLQYTHAAVVQSMGAWSIKGQERPARRDLVLACPVDLHTVEQSYGEWRQVYLGEEVFSHEDPIWWDRWP
jgi:hypothetical protein